MPMAKEAAMLVPCIWVGCNVCPLAFPSVLHDPVHAPLPGFAVTPATLVMIPKGPKGEVSPSLHAWSGDRQGRLHSMSFQSRAEALTLALSPPLYLARPSLLVHSFEMLWSGQ